MFGGKSYLVTGGSRGIGAATVKALVRAGANVALTYSKGEAAAREVVEACQGAEGRVLALQADVEDFQRARQVAEQVYAQFERIDGLVANAGITQDRPLVMMQEDDWSRVIDTNLKGTFNYVRSVIYRMIQERSGRVVCVSSVSGIAGVPGQTNYSATKAGLNGFVRTLSKEVAPYGITVNAVAPGFVETEMWAKIPEKKRSVLVGSVPLKRIGRPEEIASTILFLLSDSAAYMTGSVLVVDGGLTA